MNSNKDKDLDSSVNIDKILLQGLEFHKIGKLKKAQSCYSQVLKSNSKNFEALQLSATLNFQQKKYKESLRFLESALLINSKIPHLNYNHGNILHELKYFNEAIKSYDRAIKLNPDYAEAYYNRGNSLSAVNLFKEAVSSYDRAIQLKPDFAEAFYNRGNALKELKHLNEAISSYDQAIQLKPDHSRAFNNHGLAMHGLNKFKEAVSSYDRAIQLKPDFAEAFNNRGNALKELKHLNEAISSYDQAIQLRPDLVEVSWNKGHSKLLLGEFDEGWKLYEFRKERDKTRNDYPKFSATIWNGNESIENKTLLVHCEQGFGDTIQFSRYLLILEHLHAKEIYLMVQRPLKNLFSRFHKKINIIESNQLPKADFYCSLMSLPHLFKTKVETIPVNIPYIKLNNVINKNWEDILKNSNKVKIGLAWSGSTIHENDHNRSLKLKQLSNLLSLPFEFHCLQKEIRDCDIDTLKGCNNIFQHQNNLNDFSDTAGLINQMDLIISVDTSVAHLSGAIGKKVWLLLPFIPDFRWMLDRDDSPWYPSLKLFRQPAISDWESVIKQLIKELKKKYL